MLLIAAGNPGYSVCGFDLFRLSAHNAAISRKLGIRNGFRSGTPRTGPLLRSAFVGRSCHQLSADCEDQKRVGRRCSGVVRIDVVALECTAIRDLLGDRSGAGRGRNYGCWSGRTQRDGPSRKILSVVDGNRYNTGDLVDVPLGVL